MIIYLMLLLFFIFGLLIGSFLNVIIYRSNNDDSIARGRSYCPNCRHILSFFDLVPLLSFIFLLGRCRYCKKKISLQYPLVELATGIMAVLIFIYQLRIAHYALRVTDNNFLFLISFICLFVVFSMFLVIFVSDLLYQTVLMIPFFVGVFFSVIYLFLNKNFSLINVYCAVLAFIFFFLFNFISKGKWMGLGDAFLGFFIGLFLGFPKTFVSIYTAFLTGAILGVILILTGRKKFGQKIAFGPFLIFGTVLAFFYGNFLWKIFLDLTGAGTL